MTYIPLPKGQAAMSASVPVVVASDQAAIAVNLAASATVAGLSCYSSVDLQSTGVNIKASAGKMQGYSLFNLIASYRVVRLYDKATAPTSSDTPIRRIVLPASGGVERTLPHGQAFANGLGVRCTQLVADNDTTAPGASDVVGNFDYV